MTIVNICKNVNDFQKTPSVLLFEIKV